MSSQKFRTVRKVVIPVAGLGTRLLPFTKSVPKEMLPIGTRPLIQFAVEEAAASGMDEVILVQTEQKSVTLRHFERDPELESLLEKRDRTDEAERLRRLSQLAHLRVALQREPLGLGHAISCCRDLVSGEPFGVILPDAFMVSKAPVLAQMVEAYQVLPGSYIATREVEDRELHRYGILKIESGQPFVSEQATFRVAGVVEKPKPSVAPSRFGVFGRYILHPAVFDCLDRVRPDDHNEIQLTDAIALLCRDHDVYGFRFEGEHYDTGCKLGYMEASVEMALRDPEMGDPFLSYLRSLHL